MDRPDLTSPKVLRDFVQRHGLAPRKGLGQHWLCSSKVVDAIVHAASGCKSVLEIGPGAGVLTGPLSDHAAVVAMDIDARVCNALAESAPSARVIIEDVLQADLGALLNEQAEPSSIVSNLPYYITGAVLTKLCEVSLAFERAVLMMQAEVADRIAAGPGDSNRGSLSVLLQHHFTVSLVCKVPPTAFLPPPKVESKVLLLESRRRSHEKYLELARSGFQQPRKTLANNLKSVLTNEQIAACGLDLRVRPHQLSEQQWRCLADQLNSQS